MDHFAVVEAHDPPGMVPMMKITNDGQMGVLRPYFDVENPGAKSTLYAAATSSNQI